MHRGRALAAFNQLLTSRVENLKIEGRSNASGQTNVQSDVQTLLSPISEKEQSLLSSVRALFLIISWNIFMAEMNQIDQNENALMGLAWFIFLCYLEDN